MATPPSNGKGPGRPRQVYDLLRTFTGAEWNELTRLMARSPDRLDHLGQAVGPGRLWTWWRRTMRRNITLIAAIKRRNKPRSQEERDREIVRLHDDEGLTFGEIARRLKIPGKPTERYKVVQQAYRRTKRRWRN
jgi:hypothetical protein